MSSGAGEVGGTQTGSGVSSRSDCDRLVGRRLWLVFPGACVAAIAVGPCGGSTTEPPAAEPTATFPPSAVVPRRKCLAMASAENYFFNWSIHATCGGTVRRGIARVEGSRRDRQSGLNNASRFRVRIGPRPEELHETLLLTACRPEAVAQGVGLPSVPPAPDRNRHSAPLAATLDLLPSVLRSTCLYDLFHRRFQASVSSYRRTRGRILTDLGDQLGCHAALRSECGGPREQAAGGVRHGRGAGQF